jgi:hypothetical protein
MILLDAESVRSIIYQMGEKSMQDIQHLKGILDGVTEMTVVEHDKGHPGPVG